MAATASAPYTLLHLSSRVYIPTCSYMCAHTCAGTLPLPTNTCLCAQYGDQHSSMMLITVEVLPSVSGERTSRHASYSTLLTVVAEAHTNGFVPCVRSRSFAMAAFVFWSLQLAAVEEAQENQGFTWNQLSGPAVTACGCPI